MISWSFKLQWRSLSTSIPTFWRQRSKILQEGLLQILCINIKIQEPSTTTMMSGAKLVANRKISAAYVVRDSDCQVCGATWSQPSPFIKLTCSWRSLIFTNVLLEMNMEQNGWYERYLDVLFYLMLDIYYYQLSSII